MGGMAFDGKRKGNNHKIKTGLSAVVKAAVENNDVFSMAVFCMNVLVIHNGKLVSAVYTS